MENQTWRLAHKNGPEEDSERKLRKDATIALERIMAVPWRRNEDDAKMDGERELKS